MRITSFVLAAAGAFLLSSAAIAVPVNVTINSENTSILPAPGDVVNTLPDSRLPVVQIIAAGGTVSGQYRSPYENTSGTLPSGYEHTPYTSVQAGGTGFYNVGAGSTFLSLLWGSPDSYNVINFYSLANGGGSIVGSIIGSDLAAYLTQPGVGHDQVSLTVGTAFLSFSLSSIGQNAFEFTDLACSPTGAGCANGPGTTPLPGALPLFASGLGMLGAYGWRRRRQQA